MTWPTASYVVGFGTLMIVSPGVGVVVTVAVAHGLLVRPLPDAQATFVIEPASRSAWVIVCAEVQLVVAPGASGPEPHGEIVPCLLSVIVNGPARVTLPLLTIVYV